MNSCESIEFSDMHGTISAVLQQLASQHLPVLPQGTKKLLAALNDDNLDFSQLAATLALYPTIVARLISLANSAWSAPQSEITSLSQACARLGMTVVRSCSTALAVAAPFNNLLHCPHFNTETYWTRAFAVSSISFQLANSLKGHESPQALRTAGLLHNLGLLWLADQLPILTQQSLLHAQSQAGEDLDKSLQKIVGAGYTEAGAYLARRWEMSSLFSQVMAHHRKPSSILSQQCDDAHIQNILIIRAAIQLIALIESDKTKDEAEEDQTDSAAIDEDDLLYNLNCTAKLIGIEPEALVEKLPDFAKQFERSQQLVQSLF